MLKAKKILFITAFTPSGFSAGQSYTLNLLSDLKKHYRIDLVYFQYGEQSYRDKDIKLIKEVKLSLLKKILNFILCPFLHPIFSNRFSWSILLFLKRQVKANRYDLIYFDFGQVFFYSLFFPSHKKLLMAHDIFHQKFSRKGTWLERAWLSLIEKIIFAQKNIQILTFSNKDQTLIKKLYNQESKVTNFYLSQGIISFHNNNKTDNYFCFYGAWNRKENSEGLEWFITNVAPYVKKSKFVIIGTGLSDKLNKLITSCSIQYLGYLEDPYNVIRKSKALIAPLFSGAGVKVKVIESLACGTPVIGTEIALEGIPMVLKGSLSECVSSKEFIHTINTFNFPNENRSLLQKLFLKEYGASLGKDFIEKYID